MKTISIGIANPVASGGTISGTYPSGETRTSYISSGATLSIGNNTYTTGFTLTLGASSFTVTNPGQAIAAGTSVRLSMKTPSDNAGRTVDALARTVGYVEYPGSPIGNVTPDFVNQKCLDTTNSVMYVAVGSTNTSWRVMSMNPLQFTEWTTAGTFNFTVPSNTYVVTARLAGSGAGGGGGHATGGGGGGGGAGDYWDDQPILVQPGDVLSITVPAGGTAGPVGNNGGAGASATIVRGGVTLLSAAGGAAGQAGAATNGGAGGSSGGTGFGLAGGGTAGAPTGGNGTSAVKSARNIPGSGGAGGGGTTGAGGTAAPAQSQDTYSASGGGNASGGGGGICAAAKIKGSVAPGGASGLGGATPPTTAPGCGGGGGGQNGTGGAGQAGYAALIY